jgi:hypothetical protein
MIQFGASSGDQILRKMIIYAFTKRKGNKKRKRKKDFAIWGGWPPSWPKWGGQTRPTPTSKNGVAHYNFFFSFFLYLFFLNGKKWEHFEEFKGEVWVISAYLMSTYCSKR